jgi:large subunit ribosomal protein L10
MPKAEKVERVAELKQRIEGSAALLLAEYRGLTVSEISELRRSLREQQTQFAVVKNTLMARAAADAGIQELQGFLEGPSAVAFVDGDPVTAAKTLKAATKQFPALIVKGGYMDGRVLTAEDASALADLESREVMLSKIAGLMKGEMSRAAAMFVSAQSKFLGVLEAYKAKLPGEEAPAEEPVAEATSADELEAAPTEEPEAEAAEAAPTEEAETVAEAEEPQAEEATEEAAETAEAEPSDEAPSDAAPNESDEEGKE